VYDIFTRLKSLAFFYSMCQEHLKVKARLLGMLSKPMDYSESDKFRKQFVHFRLLLFAVSFAP
jgi:hypothetical protein